MNAKIVRVAWYCFRANLSRRWPSYLIIMLLIGLVGGIAIGSVVAARRTQSSFDTYLASTNPSDMSVLLYGPNLATKLSKLPLVRHVATSYNALNAFPAGRHGAPRLTAAQSSGEVTSIGSLQDEYTTQDKLTVLEGRAANPRRADQFVASADAERLMGWHVGEAIPMYFYTSAQTNKPGFGTAKVKPRLIMTMHLVGIVALSIEVVSDEVDRYPTPMIFTPALTRHFAAHVSNYFYYGLQLQHGARDVSKVEQEIIGALPPGTTYTFLVTSVYAGEVNRSIEPEALALAVFGLIAALAMLIITGGLIARVLQGDSDDLEIFRAVGANQLMRSSVVLLGPLGATVIGAMLAVVVGVLLSLASPIGPVRAVYPGKGVAFDWTVLGLGFAIIVVGLSAIALLVTRREVRRPGYRFGQPSVPLGASVARRLVDAGLPMTAALGARFALGSGRGRDAPVRSALIGSVVAVAIVVSTLTFGSSLHTLISRPSLYGWNWNYALTSGGNVPPQSSDLLSADPYVAAWSGINLANAQIDGLTVPILLVSEHAAVSPPLLSGHEVDGPGQIVLGAATMQALHKRLGQTVIGSYGTPKDAPVYVPPTRLTIVGTTTLPAVGSAQSLHTTMGIGAIIPIDIEPPAFRKFLTAPYPTLNGWQLVLVRLRHGASPIKALASLKKIAAVGDRALAAVPNGEGAGDSVGVLAVQYPAEIENYRTTGAVPAALALGLAVGAVVALGLTLAASVRRKRRDLALLRALGFVRRQLASTIAWQASVDGVIGVVIGVPLGILLGRWLWTLFARGIYAVPEPTVPVISLVIVGVSALVLVNLVAALPGRIAAGTSTAQVLHDQ